MSDNTENAAPAGEAAGERTVQQDNTPRPKPPAIMAGAMPRAIVPKDMDEAWRIANLLVRSGLAPKDVQTPERAMVAIMTGLELGLPPMTAIQRIAIINGRPCIWGDAVPAIAQRTGMLEAWDEDTLGEGDDMLARCTVTRRVNGESTISKTATFSVADAKKAGLWTTEAKVERKNRNGEKYIKDNDSPWYRFPRRMLQMRARVAFRDLFADAMCGLFVAEELVGRDSDAEMRDVTPPAQPIIHNPLQDDAEAIPAFRYDMAHMADFAKSGDVPSKQLREDTEAQTQSGVSEQGAGRAETMVDPPPTDKAPLDHDPETGEVFDAKVDSERRDAEDPPPAPAAKPPRQARRKAQDAPESAPVVSQPEAEKVNPAPNPASAPAKTPDPIADQTANAQIGIRRPPRPAPNPALSVTLEQPWSKRGPADYIAYVLKWTEAWIAWGQDPNGLRDRYLAERDIRNKLLPAMDEKQLAEAKAIAAGAFGRLGGVLK